MKVKVSNRTIAVASNSRPLAFVGNIKPICTSLSCAERKCQIGKALIQATLVGIKAS
jgi:hypothetical protein